VLELGPGSGRVTKVFLKSSINYNNLDLVDLSNDMINGLKKKFNDNKINIYKNDSLDYLNKVNKKYDLVYSLWSFSHSVHQHIVERNSNQGQIKKILKKFIANNMNPGANFFLIHFDSQSEEQNILMKQWGKYFSAFSDQSKQSPSKLILDNLFSEMSGNIIDNFECNHLIGDPIVYKTLDEALETIMNFHMETEFNKHKDTEMIVKELTENINKHTRSDGKYYIKPGCFMYTFKRI